MIDFRFHNPEFLLFLISIPIYWLLVYFAKVNAQKKLSQFAHNSRWGELFLGITQSKFSNFLKTASLSLTLFCLVLALARPQANPTFEERSSSSLDIMVLLDVSKSMDAEDIYPSRLKKAKREINTLLQQLEGDRVGIIAFAGSAVLVTPLTNDYAVINTFLEAIDSSMIQNQGTNIEAAVEEALSAVERGGVNNLNENNRGSVVLLLMSDGEEQEGSAQNAAKLAKEKGAVLHSIAFGTEKGAPIAIRSDSGELLAYKRDTSGNPVISQVKGNALKDLAKIGGGNFYFATLDEKEIQDIVISTKNLQRNSNKLIQAKVYQEFFLYPLLAGTLLLFGQYFSLFSLWALFYAQIRKKFLLKASFLFLTLLVNTAHAKEENIPWYGALFWTEEKIALEKAKAKQEEQKASEELKNAAEKKSAIAKMQYNYGTALAQEKQLEEAGKALEQAKENTQKDELDLKHIEMNQAGLEALKKNPDLAISQYADFLQKNGGNSSFSQLAKKNIERLARQSQQQQQQQGEGSSSEGEQQKKNSSEEQEKESKSKAQENKNEKGQQGEQNKEKKGPQKYERGKNPFQGKEDLNEETAKNILESLKAGENALQKKFLRQKESGEEESNGKDW